MEPTRTTVSFPPQPSPPSCPPPASLWSSCCRASPRWRWRWSTWSTRAPCCPSRWERRGAARWMRNKRQLRVVNKLPVTSCRLPTGFRSPAPFVGGPRRPGGGLRLRALPSTQPTRWTDHQTDGTVPWLTHRYCDQRDLSESVHIYIIYIYIF